MTVDDARRRTFKGSVTNQIRFNFSRLHSGNLPHIDNAIFSGTERETLQSVHL
jgi:hypothetical protein